MDTKDFSFDLDDIELIVKRYLHDKKCDFSGKFRIKKFGLNKINDGETIGFLGDHYILNVHLKEKGVTYSTDQDKVELEEKSISFFMKILPEDIPEQSNYISEMKCFKKEIKLFNGVLPRLQDICIATHPFAAKCYFSKDEKQIIFENLTADGYQIVKDKNGIFDYEHLELALKTVAKLHATSLVLEERTQQHITKLYPGCLDENAYVDDDEYVRKLGLENAIEAFCELIKNIEEYKESEHLENILEKFPDIVRKQYEFVKPSTIYRNVLNHGDLWSNNIMFKYREVVEETESNGNKNGSTEVLCVIEETSNNDDQSQEEGQVTKKLPVECRLVDFQLSRYCPPAMDVMSLITLTTDSDFRKENLDRLLDVYYESLAGELSWHYEDISEIFSKALFKESCEHFLLAGLIESCLFSHLTLLPHEISSKFMASSEAFCDFIRNSRVAICIEAFENFESYKSRMSDMLKQIIELFILN